MLTERVIIDASINCKLAAVRKIDTEEYLKDLLRYERMPNVVVRNIVKKLTNQFLLEEMFLSEKVSHNAKSYISYELSNKEFLEGIAKDESQDEDIRVLACNRLEEL